MPIATGTHQIDDGPLVETGTGGLQLEGPTGAVAETFFAVINGTSNVYVGAIDGTGGYLSSIGVPLVISSDVAVQVSLGDYANDAAAATAGVPIDGLYRTASVVKVRVA